MGFLSRIFTKKNTSDIKETVPSVGSENQEKHSDDPQWVSIPAYIETEPEEYKLPAVISATIAAGDRPDSTFKIKRILKRNPEAHFVSLIASSLAAGSYPESQFVIKSIKKLNSK